MSLFLGAYDRDYVTHSNSKVWLIQHVHLFNTPLPCLESLYVLFGFFGCINFESAKFWWLSVAESQWRVLSQWLRPQEDINEDGLPKDQAPHALSCRLSFQGVQQDKQHDFAAVWVANMVRFWHVNWPPSRSMNWLMQTTSDYNNLIAP